MRSLGWLFVIAILLASVAYFRGWFSITTSQAAGKSGVTMEVDKDKVGADAKAAAAQIGELSAKAAEKLKSLGRSVGPDKIELEGTLTAVDQAGRSLTVNASSEAIELHVPAAVTITRAGASVDFSQLQPGTRAKFTFEHAGDVRRLSRVEIVP